MRRFLFYLPALLLLDLLGALAAATGCSGHARMGRGPEFLTTTQPPGPPPLASGQSYRRKMRRYYYYPETEVYLGAETGKYFWREGGKWTSGPQVPAGIRLDETTKVVIEQDTNQPYLEHQRISKEHPAKPEPQIGSASPTESVSPAAPEEPKVKARSRKGAAGRKAPPQGKAKGKTPGENDR